MRAGWLDRWESDAEGVVVFDDGAARVVARKALPEGLKEGEGVLWEEELGFLRDEEGAQRRREAREAVQARLRAADDGGDILL